MPSSASPGSRLRAALARGPVVAVTAYDMVAARLVAQAGFDAVFCSGYGQAASGLGLPDAGHLSLDFVAARAEAMVRTSRVPVLVDADDGWDDPAGAVARLAAVGAAAVMIEDQVSAKRCGHIPGKSVIALEEMVARVEEAARARTADVVLVARTDAREPLGLDEALRRGRAYAEAGADVVFVEAPETTDELAEIPRELPVPAMANMLADGRTPTLPVTELSALGFSLIVFGLVDLMVAAHALQQAFGALRAAGDVGAVGGRLSFAELNRLMDGVA